MKKVLKIRFTKFERALAMQVLEQQGLPERKEDGFARISWQPELSSRAIFLRGESAFCDWDIARYTFENNDERDSYLDKAVKAITEELFTGEARELKIGEDCEVSENNVHWGRRTLLAVVPEGFGIRDRFLAKSEGAFYHHALSWRYARPLVGRVEPVVELLSDGDAVYAWESKEGE